MNGNLNSKIVQEQAALVAQASRIQTRASMFLTAANLIQDYVGLTQRLLGHINDLNKSALADGGTIPPTTQGDGPQSNSSGSRSPVSAGD